MPTQQNDSCIVRVIEHDDVALLHPGLEDHAARVIALFRKWDEDGSGAVNRREFRALGPLLRDAVDAEVTHQP